MCQIQWKPVYSVELSIMLTDVQLYIVYDFQRGHLKINWSEVILRFEGFSVGKQRIASCENSLKTVTILFDNIKPKFLFLYDIG